MTKMMSKTDRLPNSSSDVHWRILIELTDQLKLSDLKYDDAVDKYNDVATWLKNSDNEIFRDVTIYVQGSVKLGTTVKPYARAEYDIDLVIHLPHLNESHSSEYVHQAIGDRLNYSETYRPMVSPLNRGWRIDYSGDFHLDITPAIPDYNCDNLCPINKKFAEFVPDKKLKFWKASNPRGYLEWFHDIDKTMPSMLQNDAKTNFALEARTIEKAPSQDEYKGILRRTVQLLKRHRDIYFHETVKTYKEWAPISILITTLVAHSYKNIVERNIHYAPVELIKEIIRNMKNHIEIIDEQPYVANPTNLKENFAEKWSTSLLYGIMFKEWSEVAIKDIEDILNAEGMDIIGKSINASFGGNYGNKVIESISRDVSENREIGALSGVFTLKDDTVASVAKNTFYGE